MAAAVADPAECREWQEVLRISEELHASVSKLQAKLASERALLAADRAAAAADRRAAAADRESVERLVHVISSTVERWYPAGAVAAEKAMPETPLEAAPGASSNMHSRLNGTAPKAMVKQPPRQPSSLASIASPASLAAATAAPMPGPPPMPSRSPPPAQTQTRPQETLPAPPSQGQSVGGTRVKAPPAPSRRQGAVGVAASEPRVKEPPPRGEVSKDPRVEPAAAQGSFPSEPASVVPSGTDAAQMGQEQEGDRHAEASQDEPAQNTPARSAADKVGEAASEPPALPASSHSKEPHSSAEACDPFLDHDLDDDDEDEEEADEAEIWAMSAPDPPSKAPPPGSPHYRVMAPPRAEPLPQTEPFPPSEDARAGPLGSPPEMDREHVEGEPSESEPMQTGDSATSRIPVKAMPCRESGSSSSAASPWPVGKAAAGRFKAPPAMCSSAASSSESRRPMDTAASEAPTSAAVTAEAPVGMPTSSVKAPPALRGPNV